MFDEQNFDDLHEQWEGFLIGNVCLKCHFVNNDILIYCMTVMYEADPEKWVCEACNSSNQIPSSKSAPSRQPSGTRMRLTIKKSPQNTKVQHLSLEEAKVLDSGSMRCNLSSPSVSHFAHRAMVKKPSISKMEAVPSSSLPTKFRIKLSLPIGISGSREPANDLSMPSCLKDPKLAAATDFRPFETYRPARQRCGESLTDKSVSFRELPTPGGGRDNVNSAHTLVQLGQRLPALSLVGRTQQYLVKSPTSKYFPLGKPSKDYVNSRHASQLAQSPPVVDSGINVCNEAQSKEIDSKERESPTVTLVLDSYLPNHPAMSPTWKGTFKIRHGVYPSSIFNEIQAHPPCKVHSKVYNMSKKFPKTHMFEMHSQWNSWVTIFEDDVPGELDIGLYFLSSCEHERSYHPLLEYLDKHDLLLKTRIDQVELFVFSSKHLPEDSHKINQKRFLWGLFRPCRHSTSLQ